MKMIHNVSKKYKSFIAALLAVVMVVGVFAFIAPVSAQAVELSAEEKPFYNVSYNANGATTFDAGTRILLINNTAKAAGKEKSEAVYALSGDGALAWSAADVNEYVVWQGTGDNTFYGVYPYTAAYDNFTLPTEQDTAEELAEADWMTATTTAANTDGSLNLNFEHLLSKVTVKVSGYGTEYTGSEAISDVRVFSLGTSLSATYGDETTVTVAANKTAITPLSDENGYTAIVAPGAYQAEDTFISFQVDGEELTVSVKNNETLLNGLESGKHYTFNLTVGKDQVELTEVVVNAWKDGGNIDGGVAEAHSHSLTYSYVDSEYIGGFSLTHTVSCSTCDYDETVDCTVSYIDRKDGTHWGYCDYCAFGDMPLEENHSLTNCVCDDCSAVWHLEVDSNTGICTTCGELGAAAEVTTADGASTYYATFDDALSAAMNAEGSAIVLQNDCAMDTVGRNIKSGRFSIDLNGKSVYSGYNFALRNWGADVEIFDSVGGGAVTGNTVVRVDSNGKTTIKSGTFVGIENAAILYVEGGDCGVLTIYSSNTTLAGGSYEQVQMSKDLGTLDQILAEGYCFYDQDGNEVDLTTISDDGDYYVLNNVTVGLENG